MAAQPQPTRHRPVDTKRAQPASIARHVEPYQRVARVSDAEKPVEIKDKNESSSSDLETRSGFEAGHDSRHINKSSTKSKSLNSAGDLKYTMGKRVRRVIGSSLNDSEQVMDNSPTGKTSETKSSLPADIGKKGRNLGLLCARTSSAGRSLPPSSTAPQASRSTSFSNDDSMFHSAHQSQKRPRGREKYGRKKGSHSLTAGTSSQPRTEFQVPQSSMWYWVVLGLADHSQASR
jgi:hypothetical protein